MPAILNEIKDKLISIKKRSWYNRTCSTLPMASSTTFRKYERNLSEDENLALDIISAYYRLIIFDTFGIRSYTT